MNRLDIRRINIYAPYKVWEQEDGINFETDYGLRYVVDFDDDANPYYTAYWFNLKNKNSQKSPGDVKIPQTIICIIEEFFRQNPYILLYYCSTDNGQQAQRARLFMRWFNGSAQQQRYCIRSTDVRSDRKKEKDYVALIVQRTHPYLDDILRKFDEEIGLFNDMKP